MFLKDDHKHNMSKIPAPSDLTKTLDESAQTITLRWAKPVDQTLEYEIRFLDKLTLLPATANYIQSSAATRDGKTNVVLKCIDKKDFAAVKSSFAEVRFVRKIKGEAEAGTWKRETSWTAGGLLIFKVAGHDLVLSSDLYARPGRYEGALDLGKYPVELVAVVNRFLSGQFGLTLPGNFPADMKFYELSGMYQSKAPQQFKLEALTDVDFHNPFNRESKAKLSFKKMKLRIEKSETAKYLGMSAEIHYNPSDEGASDIHFGDAVIVFSEKNYVVGLEIKENVSSAQILERLLGIDIDNDIRQLLPEFRPEPGKAIRLYKTSEKYPRDQVYRSGFNLDQLIVRVLGTDFHVSMQIDQGFSMDTSVEKIVLLENVLELTGSASNTASGVNLHVASAPNKSVALSGGLLLFPTGDKEKIDFSFAYASGEFSGVVAYEKSIMGMPLSPFKFAWSDKGGFRIIQLPLDFGDLLKALDWTKQLKNFANSLNSCEEKCEEITDLAFNEVIRTNFKLDYKMAKGLEKQVGVEISGKFILTVLGNDIEIAFDPLLVTLDIPTGFNDLGKKLVSSLIHNLEHIVSCLWDNKGKLAELLALLTFVEGLKSARAAACRFACQAGKDAMRKALEKALEEALKKAAETVAEVAVAALEEAAAVIVAAVGILKALQAIWDWITGEDKKKKAEQERRKAEAEQRIRSLTPIHNLKVKYVGIDAGKRIRAEWDKVNADAGKGRIFYIVRLYEKAGANYILRHQSGELDVHSTLYEIGRSDFRNGVEYKVNIQTMYRNGDTYHGGSSEKSITTPILEQTVPEVTFDWADEMKRRLGTIDVSWKEDVHIVPAGMTDVRKTGFCAQLYEGEKLLATQNVAAAHCAFNLYNHDTGTAFIPDKDARYTVKLQAIASDTDLNSPWSQSQPFSVPWGIGSMRIGYNFKIG